MKNEPMLSVAQVCEMQPGTEQDPTWVNPGLVGYVEKIVATKTKKTGSAMNICTLRDVNGSAVISLTVFGPVKFNEGDTIEVRDGGIRRTEYNGMAQVSLGKNTTLHVVNAGRAQVEAPPARPAPQARREGAPTPPPAAGGQRINGQTVGMAMKEAIPLVVQFTAAQGLKLHLDTIFWSEVHKQASAIIRLSNALEHGNLTPPLSTKAVPVAQESTESKGGRADAPKGAMPKPGIDGAVALSEDDEEVPF